MNESLQWLAVASSTRDSQGPAPPACTGAERWSRQVAPERSPRHCAACCLLFRLMLGPFVGLWCSWHFGLLGWAELVLCPLGTHILQCWEIFLH